MEEKEKVCSEDVEQKENVAAEAAGSLTEKELEDAAGGITNVPSSYYQKKWASKKA